MSAAKPKVAFFDFTGCEGCQLTVIDALQTHPELLDAVEIVEFREAMSEKSDRYYIAFVEGSCSRESDEARLRQIRERAAVVVALGACAHLGGVNAIRNNQDPQQVRSYVYGDKADWFDSYRARGIAEVIDVDAVIPGCPIDRDEFVKVVRSLLQGRIPGRPTSQSASNASCRKTSASLIAATSVLVRLRAPAAMPFARPMALDVTVVAA